MIEWIFVIFSLFGMANNYYSQFTQTNNGARYLYLHPNGYYYDFPPQVREYQNQGQEAVATPYWTQGGTRYYYGQSPQATPYPQGY
jgi:hypothetical protein